MCMAHQSRTWTDYELLDSGGRMKLERFGEVVLARPETQALWEKKRPQLWEKANATFFMREGKGVWNNRNAPKEWKIAWGSAVATLRLTNFKHVGIFPEQAANWEWLQGEVNKRENPRVLNLFGYTGLASIVAAQAGALVTHLDASKTTLDWANENREASGLERDAIRWIFDDTLTFVRREVKRGNTYDGIVLDPPAFGRGGKGEVWHIETDLPKLLNECAKLLTPDGFLLLNGYAAGYTPTSFRQLLESHFPNRTPASGELFVENADGTRISSGIFARI